MRRGLLVAAHCPRICRLWRTDCQKPRVWAGRHRGDAEKKACRKSFTFEKAISPLEDRAPDIHALAVMGYERAIDYGAHPNIKGVFGHVSLNDEREDGFTAVTHTSLCGSAHIETIRGLCACLDFGFAIIGIIALSGPTISDNLVDGLQALSDAKNAAVAPYQSPNS